MTTTGSLLNSSLTTTSRLSLSPRPGGQLEQYSFRVSHLAVMMKAVTISLKACDESGKCSQSLELLVVVTCKYSGNITEYTLGHERTEKKVDVYFKLFFKNSDAKKDSCYSIKQKKHVHGPIWSTGKLSSENNPNSNETIIDDNVRMEEMKKGKRRLNLTSNFRSAAVFKPLHMSEEYGLVNYQQITASNPAALLVPKLYVQETKFLKGRIRKKRRNYSYRLPYIPKIKIHKRFSIGEDENEVEIETTTKHQTEDTAIVSTPVIEDHTTQPNDHIDNPKVKPVAMDPKEGIDKPMSIKIAMPPFEKVTLQPTVTVSHPSTSKTNHPSTSNTVGTTTKTARQTRPPTSSTVGTTTKTARQTHPPTSSTVGTSTKTARQTRPPTSSTVRTTTMTARQTHLPTSKTVRTTTKTARQTRLLTRPTTRTAPTTTRRRTTTARTTTRQQPIKPYLIPFDKLNRVFPRLRPKQRRQKRPKKNKNPFRIMLQRRKQMGSLGPDPDQTTRDPVTTLNPADTQKEKPKSGQTLEPLDPADRWKDKPKPGQNRAPSNPADNRKENPKPGENRGPMSGDVSKGSGGGVYHYMKEWWETTVIPIMDSTELETVDVYQADTTGFDERIELFTTTLGGTTTEVVIGRAADADEVPGPRFAAVTEHENFTIYIRPVILGSRRSWWWLLATCFFLAGCLKLVAFALIIVCLNYLLLKRGYVYDKSERPKRPRLKRKKVKSPPPNPAQKTGEPRPVQCCGRR